MQNYIDNDLTQWNNAGDYSSVKTKSGKDKRLTDKSERKAMKAFRKARQNRHSF